MVIQTSSFPLCGLHIVNKFKGVVCIRGIYFKVEGKGKPSLLFYLLYFSTVVIIHKLMRSNFFKLLGKGHKNVFKKII